MLLVFQAVALKVFEPRYRLMVRRCLDGDRRFGMLGPADLDTFKEGEGYGVGSEVEIKDCRQLHDGRYHIQVRPPVSLLLRAHYSTQYSSDYSED